MALSTKLCFALIVSGCFITRTSRTQLLDKGTPNERQTDTSDNQTEERSKRSLPTLLGQVLKKARLLFVGHNYKVYGKPGGYTAAAKDFDRLKLSNVGEFGVSKWGTLGDKVVTLQPQGRRATLNILPGKGSQDIDIEIIYRNTNTQ